MIDVDDPEVQAGADHDACEHQCCCSDKDYLKLLVHAVLFSVA